MQLFKVVFTLIAVGGPSYALFRISRIAPGWVKILSFILGFSTLIGTMIVLPQALDALEQTARKVAGYFAPSESDQHQQAQIEQKRKADEQTRPRPVDGPVQQPPTRAEIAPKGTFNTSGDNSPIVSGAGGDVNIKIDGPRR
jgi:hypothetical protein